MKDDAPQTPLCGRGAGHVVIVTGQKLGHLTQPGWLQPGSCGQIIPSFLARRTASPRRVAPSFRKMLLK